MFKTNAVLRALAYILPVGALAACGGAVDPASGGPGGGGSSSGVSGSSSGPTTVSSSGSTTGSSSGTSSGATSSSGGPVTDPHCTGLGIPTVALLCPDGSAAAPYYVWDGTSCRLAYQCSPPAGPPPPTSSSSGVGGSSGSSSGVVIEPTPPACTGALPDICEVCSNGETECAHYVIVNGACSIELCPPANPPPVGVDCAPGAPCQAGTGCGTASAGPSGCSTSCTCGASGVYECSETCVPDTSPPAPLPSPPVTGCAQGQTCQPGEGCGGGPDAYGCFTSCTCSSSTYTFECAYDCGLGAVDAGVAVAEDAAIAGW